MTCEDAAKEIYTKTASSVHQYKMTMQAMVVIAMAWEGVSATVLSLKETLDNQESCFRWSAVPNFE